MSKRPVLQLDTALSWRGGQNQVALLCRGMVEKGRAVHLAASEEGQLFQRLKGELPSLGLKAPWYHPANIWRLRRYVRDHGIGVVDAHSADAHSLAWAARVPCKLVVHRRVDNPPSTGGPAAWRYRSPKVDRFVAISSHIAEVLGRHGVLSSRITTVPSGVSLEAVPDEFRRQARQQLNQRWGISDATAVIANVAYMTKQKGHSTLLSALGQLRQRLSEPASFRCFIAGGGELESELRQQASDLGLGQHLVFLGICQEVKSLLAAADIFCMPSQNEGLGTSLLDALAAGCSLVATRVGGIPEIIEDGVSGLLSEPGDHQHLMHNLERLIQEPHLGAGYGKVGLERARERFSVERMVSGNIAVYESLEA